MVVEARIRQFASCCQIKSTIVPREAGRLQSFEISASGVFFRLIHLFPLAELGETAVLRHAVSVETNILKLANRGRLGDIKCPCRF